MKIEIRKPWLLNKRLTLHRDSLKWYWTWYGSIVKVLYLTEKEKGRLPC